MDFTYEAALGSEGLRLLAPISVTREALHFSITTVPRRFAPPYTAVSYCWGDDEASELVHLNGRRFWVRLNLWSCLYYLGLDAGRGGYTHLWVDAICINQSDDAERNAQVRRMDQTYRSAACVSVWLGLPTVPDDRTRGWPEHVPVKTIEADPFDWSDNITDIANRVYWSRIWVIQEFLLGQNVVLCCSNKRIDWQAFQTILCWETGVDEFDPDFGTSRRDTNRAAALTHGALPLVMHRHVDKYPEYLQPLYDLVVRHHRSECRDPRDRVFALLGLVTPLERRLLERFFPDYSISVDHVRIIALAHVLQSQEPLPLQVEITPDSEELFLGLGVTTKRERRRLLRRAGEFDYLGDWAFGQATGYLVSSDELDGYRHDEHNERDEPETAHRSSTLPVVKLGLAVVGCMFILSTAALIARR